MPHLASFPAFPRHLSKLWEPTVRISLCLCIAAGVLHAQAPTIAVVANAAPFQEGTISPGLDIAVFGTNLASGTAICSTVSGVYPTVCNGAVSVNVAAYTSAVLSQNGGNGIGAFVNASGSLISSSNPAHPGDSVSLYAIGLGATSPILAAGTQVPANQIYDVTAPISMSVGGQNASVAAADLANVGLPTGLTLNGAIISGTPTGGPGRASVSLTATDADENSYTKAMAIDVIGEPPALAWISIGDLYDCTIGISCERLLKCWDGGTAPFTWSVSGLPPGMSFRYGSGNTQSGITPTDVEIYSVPLQTGAFNVTAVVTDVNGVPSTQTYPPRTGNRFVTG
jgi:hypothetical protein